ncbi:MAG: hypothetical protein ABIO46_08065 [Chitinophagales bacterium]
MKKSRNPTFIIVFLLLVVASLVVFIFSSNKKNKEFLNEALSQQRIEYEQKMIAQNDRFEETLKQQREAMEDQSDREAEWIAKDIKVDEAVKNITTFLKVAVSFKDKFIGGVENVNVSVSNTSDFKMEQVTVKLSYLKKGVEYTSKTVTFYEVQPHATVSITAPDGASGNGVKGIIYKVKSAALGHP